MELDLGVKLKRATDDFTSAFRFAKDRAGPVFLSHETYTLFILTAHLKGYKRSNIRIDINEDGSLIAISSEKHVRETVMMGWEVYKKDTEIKKFKKVFRIPNGVILDDIKAKFNEDDSTLTISMPKKAKGIQGTPLEEVKEDENEDLVKQGSGHLQILDEKIQKADLDNHDVKDEENVVQEKEDWTTADNTVHEISEVKELDHNQEQQENIDLVFEEANRIEEETEKEEQEPSFDVKGAEVAREGGHVTDKPRGRGKRCKMCAPIVAGSVVLVASVVVFAVHIIRSKTQTSRRKD